MIIYTASVNHNSSCAILYSMYQLYTLLATFLFAQPLFGSPTHLLSSRALTYGPVDSNATCAARSLLTYLQKQYGSAYLSGQQDAGDLAWVVKNIGKTPAIQGNDFMDYSPSRVAFGAVSHAVEDAQGFDATGGINAFVWHWNAPTDLYNTASEPWWSGFYTAATSFNIQTALAEGPGGSDYQMLLRDIDAIAVEIQRLSDSNIPILFRPLHEPDGGWFWWGAHGPDAFLQLWDLLYDRIVNYHDLHNMVWVCNTLDPNWYPGNDKCDIATVDIYATAGDHNPQASEYNDLKALTGGARVLALAEVGVIPDPEQQHSQGIPWAYWMTWGGSYIQGGVDNSLDFLYDAYSDQFVVTVDGPTRLGSWKCNTQVAATSPVNTSTATSPINTFTAKSSGSTTSSVSTAVIATTAFNVSEYTSMPTSSRVTYGGGRIANSTSTSIQAVMTSTAVFQEGTSISTSGTMYTAPKTNSMATGSSALTTPTLPSTLAASQVSSMVASAVASIMDAPRGPHNENLKSRLMSWIEALLEKLG